MPNPFPGVNPFIEATADLWVGFHNALITFMGAQLNAALNPRGYAAIIEKRVELVDESDRDRQRLPDVTIARPDVPWPAPGGGASAALLDLMPVTVGIPRYDGTPVAYIEILSMPGHRLVTGIELLSPANKMGATRRDYTAKRAEVLSTDANLVEIDLLLGGRRPDVVGRPPPGEFCAIVSRGDRRPESEAYAWSIRRPLPRLPIPLRPGDADATLDLATAYALAFDGGPYGLILPYDNPLAGPLSDADRAWVAERVAARAR